MIALAALVVIAALVWGHYALERNVNRMAQQLQDQLNAAVARIAELEGDVADLNTADSRRERTTR